MNNSEPDRSETGGKGRGLITLATLAPKFTGILEYKVPPFDIIPPKLFAFSLAD